MSKTDVKHPDKVVSTGTCSASVLVDGWLYISGQGPLGLKTSEVLRRTIEEETRVTMRNVRQVLDLPARSTVQPVLGDGITVEIDAVARVKSDAPAS